MNLQIKNDQNINPLETLKSVPEELLWISNFNSECSKQTYQLATKQFIQYFNIKTPDQLRGITHAHIIGFRNHLQKEEKSPRTVNCSDQES